MCEGRWDSQARRDGAGTAEKRWPECGVVMCGVPPPLKDGAEEEGLRGALMGTRRLLSPRTPSRALLLGRPFSPALRILTA